jgi:hypothetical protein
VSEEHKKSMIATNKLKYLVTWIMQKDQDRRKKKEPLASCSKKIFHLELGGNVLNWHSFIISYRRLSIELIKCISFQINHS